MYCLCLPGSELPLSVFFVVVVLSYCMSLFFHHLYSIVQIYHIFFIHCLVEVHLGCFQILAIINNAALNTVEQMSLWYECASFEYMPKNVISGS